MAQAHPVVRRWYKKMSKADAQRPNEGTNPTGHLTLTKNRFPINHLTYFRDVFFGDLSWSPAQLRGRRREQATVEIEIYVHGHRVGTRALVVDFNPDYESDQRNRTTLLHWGDAMNAFLRKENVTGSYVTLERLADGRVVMSIAESPRGRFVK